MANHPRPFDPSILNPHAPHLSLAAVSRLTDENIQAIASFLQSNHPPVIKVSFYASNELGPRAQAIIEALMSNIHVLELNLHGCGLGIAELNALGPYLMCSTLTKLDVGNNLHDTPSRTWEPDRDTAFMTRQAKKAYRKRKQANPLSPFLKGIALSRSLSDLSITSIPSRTFSTSLMKALESSRSIVSFSPSLRAYTNLTPPPTFYDSIDRTRIKYLDLSHIHCYNWDNIWNVADWLGLSARITSLVLDIGLAVGEDATVHLFKSIERNHHLRHIRYTSIGYWDYSIDTGLQSMLLTNRSLTSLDLTGCFMNDEGAIVIARALESNTTLTELILGSSIITDQGAAVLLGSRLTKLVFGPGSIKEVACAISPTLRILDLSNQKLKVFVIPPDSRLTELNLGHTKISNLVIPRGALTKLCASPTRIRELRIQPGSRLRHLQLRSCDLNIFECSDSQLETLEISGGLTNIPITSMPLLTKLCVIRMPNLDVRTMMEDVRGSNITDLLLSNINLDDDAIIPLVDYLTLRSCMLTRLVIRRHMMTQAGIDSLHIALYQNISLLEHDIDTRVYEEPQ